MGLRGHFSYYLPIVVLVCRAVWYGVSTTTLSRYRSPINDGSFSVKHISTNE
ncbi:hypothetical protein PHMEG_00016000 [Phytophthora megakarya]|uniref:Uncharacterized protein n=1 Tax=Phytophthora megakarya TaxID=4795 RepID=A0A225W0C3_9STRA|nr:hypothetical protein PHMEG_00016000 [Phytophthora megakarya]